MIECPYCKHENKHIPEGCHNEDATYEMQCPKCEKYFVFTVFISFSYTSYPAECLNTDVHDFQLTHTEPKEFSKMRCSMCGEERELTQDERKQYGIDTIESCFEKIDK